MRILTIIPVKPNLHIQLKERAWKAAAAMDGCNPAHEISYLFDYTPIPSEPGDCRPWSKVTRIRNKILDSINLSAWDYLLWIDADVVSYPPNMPTLLIEANPGGVTAPVVMVEGTDAFYDWTAFIFKGASGIQPETRGQIAGRNLMRVSELPSDVTEMDCVGTVTMVPTEVHRTPPLTESPMLNMRIGARYFDDASRTDHFSVCLAAREMGRKVCVVKSIVAKHACLPQYGENWHS